MSRPSKSLLMAMQLIALTAYAVAIGVLPYALSAWFGIETDPRKSQGVTFYPWNFAPMAAVSLFAAMRLKDWRVALLVPISIKLLTDVSIGLVTQDLGLARYPYQPFIYVALLAFVIMGVLLRRENSPFYVGRRTGLADSVLRIGGAGLAAEFAFYIVTNFGSWLMFDTYPHTPAGLLQCYVAALPFFGRSLISTFMYSGFLFGGYAWLESREPARVHGVAAQRVE